MDADPSVRMTRIAEQIEQTVKRQERRDPWHDRAVFAVLAIVLITSALVGYSIYQQNKNDRSDQVTACRSELSARTMVGLARGVAEILEASVVEGAFDQQARTTAAELLERAERYENGVRLSGVDEQAFLVECQARG